MGDYRTIIRLGAQNDQESIGDPGRAGSGDQLIDTGCFIPGPETIGLRCWGRCSSLHFHKVQLVRDDAG
jgi:hypothetical protein